MLQFIQNILYSLKLRDQEPHGIALREILTRQEKVWHFLSCHDNCFQHLAVKLNKKDKVRIYMMLSRKNTRMK